VRAGASVSRDGEMLNQDGVDGPFGPAAVLLKHLVEWSHRSRVVMPPTEPNVFSYRVVHLDSLFAAIQRGIDNGDAGHLVRAAVALLELDPECPTDLAKEVRLRRVDAAREYSKTRGVAHWERLLVQATQTGRIPVVDIGTMAPLGVNRSSDDTHGARMLAALVELGFDPRALPEPRKGFSDPTKAAVRDRLVNEGMSVDFFNRTWNRLRNSGEIARAGMPAPVRGNAD
jgi:hypothetical protein